MLVLKYLKFDCFILQSQKMKWLVLLRYPHSDALVDTIRRSAQTVSICGLTKLMSRPNSVPVFMGLELYNVNFIFRAPWLSRLSVKERYAASSQGFDTV